MEFWVTLFALVCCCWVWVLMIRTEVVFRIRMRAADEGIDGWYNKYGTFEEMMSDWRKWTYWQFYYEGIWRRELGE